MSQMAGSKVVITGAEGAFGTATIARFEALGAHVVGLDIAPPTRAGNVQCDITNSDEVNAAVSAAAAMLGGIDLLINNAGVGIASPASAQWADAERGLFDVNVVGTWNVTAAALPWLLEARGHVINVSSLLAVFSLPYLSIYAASKHAICAFSNALRMEHQRDGLSVTTVYPGYVPTPIHETSESSIDAAVRDLSTVETLEQIVAMFERAALRRPRDLAATRSSTAIMRFSRAMPALSDRVLRSRIGSRGLPRPAAWTIEPPVRIGKT